MKILFLYLRGFSQIGGIEKFNRAFMKALNDTSIDNAKLKYAVLSLYDDKPDLRYVESKYFHGCDKNKIYFLFNSLVQIIRSDKIILGHINLSVIGFIAKLFSKEVILVAHGIEVWNADSSIKNYMLRNADLILSVSRFTKSKILEKSSINPEKIVVFPNTLDPYFKFNNTSQSIGLKKKYGIHSGSKIVLTVSRLSSKEQYKGYEKVINVLPGIISNFPDVKYLIVGGGDNSEINRIKILIEDLNLQDEVVLTGEIVDDELNELYRTADVFIMPSFGEGFGIVFIEALANGLSVIAGNKDGSTDPLMDGKLGILVDPCSSDQIKNALIETLNKQINEDIQNRDFLKAEVQRNFGFNRFKENLNTVLKINI